MQKEAFVFAFKNPEVADKFEAVDCPQDFKIRVPRANWPVNGDPGWFSQITLEAAEQLITEKYNRIKAKS